MLDYLEESLQEIIWPRETNVSVDIFNSGKLVFVDVDFPEVEDMPTKRAAVPSRGYKLSVKELSATHIQKLYMHHVHGIAFRIIGEAFSAIPNSEDVIFSGYSQRASKSTGQIADEYLISVRVNRSAWEGIDFSNLESLDVSEALARFELREPVTKTGIFKAIQPFDPTELELDSSSE